MCPDSCYPDFPKGFPALKESGATRPEMHKDQTDMTRIDSPETFSADYRAPGERDADKIYFSQPFRALAGKSQVHAPRAHDTIRSRLTHTIEVSRVAASLATHIAASIGPEKFNTGLLPRAIDTIRDAAVAGALMHDIGNTPFSHPGEKAVRNFFTNTPEGRTLISRLREEEKPAFLAFHGNMQAFRIATRSGWRGTMNLTPLTLAAFAKYPAGVQSDHCRIGLFHSSLEDWSKVAESLDIGQISPNVWHRHPISYITEAADDICYLTADLEDAATLDIIPATDVLTFLKAIAGPVALTGSNNSRSLFHQPEINARIKARNEIHFYRSQAIQRLIQLCTIEAHASASMLISPHKYGTRMKPLVSLVPLHETLSKIRKYSSEHIYDRRLSNLLPWDQADHSDPTPENRKHLQNACVHIARELLTPGSQPTTLRKLIDDSILDETDSLAHQLVDVATSLSDNAAYNLGSTET